MKPKEGIYNWKRHRTWKKSIKVINGEEDFRKNRKRNFKRKNRWISEKNEKIEKITSELKIL